MMSPVRNGRPSSTAGSIALARAWLTRAGVLDDPYAEHFLDRSQRWALRACELGPGARIGRRLFAYVAVRTRFYDGIIDESLDKGITQVVIVAAGYDSRSTRLARPGVRFFEVDHPATQAEKRARMQPAEGGGPVYVAADLADTPLEGVLYPAGFNPALPTVFCAEGLTLYLEETAIRELLTSAARLAAAGSRLAIDFALKPLPEDNGGQLGVRFVRALAKLQGEPLRFQTRPAGAEELLEHSGWAVDEVMVGRELHERFLTAAELETFHEWHGSFLASATIRR